MQSYTFADQLRGQHIAFDKLAGEENAKHHQNRSVIRPELRDRYAEAQHKAGHRSNIRDKGNNAGNQTDEQSEIKAGQRERCCVK